MSAEPNPIAINDPATPQVSDTAPVVAAPADPTAPEAVAPAEPAPAQFSADKLVLPEGLDKADPALAEFSKLADGLPHAKAQELIDLYTKQQKSATDANAAAWNTLHEKWISEVKADPVIGGANMPVVQQTIAKAIDQFGVPGLKDALNLTGAGNNPAIIRTFYNMAKQLTEGGHVSGQPVPNAAKSTAELFYPTKSN